MYKFILMYSDHASIQYDKYYDDFIEALAYIRGCNYRYWAIHSVKHCAIIASGYSK